MNKTTERILNGMGYYEAIEVFKELINQGWEIVDEENYSLHLKSPDDEAFVLYGALYFAVKGKIPKKGINFYHLLEKEGFDMNTFNRLQYLAEHPNYIGRELFIADIS